MTISHADLVGRINREIPSLDTDSMSIRDLRVSSAILDETKAANFATRYRKAVLESEEAAIRPRAAARLLEITMRTGAPSMLAADALAVLRGIPAEISLANPPAAPARTSTPSAHIALPPDREHRLAEIASAGAHRRADRGEPGQRELANRWDAAADRADILGRPLAEVARDSGLTF